MHLFPPPLELNPGAGFTTENDLFDRKAFGDGLRDLLTASSDPLALAINGPWGTGKTVFLKMWADELRKEDYPVIYFDAFAHDYITDAFAALSGEIITLVKNAKPAVGKKIKHATLEAGKVLLKVGANVGIKLATGGLLDAAHMADAVKDAQEALSKETDKAIEDLLAGRDKEEKALAAFREALSELPALLGNKNKPLIFIVDELDRCRPSFALELLERMKHFFAVPHLHFVLGVHQEQLEQSVKVTYGGGIDASLYLQKFISLSVNLDPPSLEGHNNSAVKYVRYLTNRMQFRQEDNETVNTCTQLITDFARDRDLKLRSLEKIMSVLAITCAFTTKQHLRLPPILAGLCVMKILAPEMFAKAQAGTLTYDEANHFFGLGREINRETIWPKEYFVRWWRYALDKSADQELVRECSSALFNYGLGERMRLVPVIATYIVDRFVRGDGR